MDPNFCFIFCKNKNSEYASKPQNKNMKLFLSLIYSPNNNPLTIKFLREELFNLLNPIKHQFIYISVNCRYVVYEHNNNQHIEIIPLKEFVALDLDYNLQEFIDEIISSYERNLENLMVHNREQVYGDCLYINYFKIVPKQDPDNDDNGPTPPPPFNPFL